MADPIEPPALFDTLGEAITEAQRRVDSQTWTIAVTLLDDGKFCVQHIGIHNRPRGLRVATVHANLRVVDGHRKGSRSRVEYHV